MPYDRVGPQADIVAKRITGLSRLAVGGRDEPTIVLTTVNAVLQRVPPRDFIRKSIKSFAPGQRADLADLIDRLRLAGYTRTGTVMEPGEFAVRGGILDIFPPGRLSPARLDFFGDTIESIKGFDAETQRTTKPLRKLIVMPVSEVAFGESATALFRKRYVELFGGATGDDPLYEAVSAGQRYPGQEHWLPFFHERLETLIDYVPGAAVSFDHLAEEAVKSRFDQIAEHYDARREGLEASRFGAPPYKPVPPERMFLDGAAWGAALEGHRLIRLTPFEEAEGPGVRTYGGRGGRMFAAERQDAERNLFDAVVAHIRRLREGQRRALVAAWTPGARERLATLFSDHGLKDVTKVESFDRGAGATRGRHRPRGAWPRAGFRNPRSSPSSPSRTSSATAWCGRSGARGAPQTC